MNYNYNIISEWIKLFINLYLKWLVFIWKYKYRFLLNGNLGRMEKMKNFDGKVVLVIGVSCGIGCVIVMRLVKDGVLVVIYYGWNKIVVDEMISEIEFNGGKVFLIEVEFNLIDGVKKLVK